MAVMGTFSQFTTARLALYASQASLSVTGNNISNINTPGYTRQRMDLVSLYSTGQGKYANIFNTNVGYGVLTNGVTRLRDPYLDIRFRNENTKLGAAQEKADGLYQIGNILDEVNKGEDGFGVIEAQFGTFFQALQDLKTNIGSEEYDDLVRAAATTLTAYFRKASSDLEDVKINKVGELNDSIGDINGLLTNIRDLNVQIRTQGIYGEKAPELRDARDLAIDELSSYIPITVTYSMESIDQWTEVEKLTITIKDSQGPDGQPIKLVDGIYGGQITMPLRMPVVNENYDPQKVIDAKREAREKAESKTETPFPTAPVTIAGMKADATWGPLFDIEGMEDRVTAAMDKAENALKANGATPTPDEIDAARAKAAENILRPHLVKKAEQEAEDAQTAAGNAKYILYSYDANGNIERNPDGTLVPGSYTNDWDEATTKQGTLDFGIYNYDEKDQINPNALYMLRVDRLVDQRGRVMEDKNDPSGKSQIIPLDDVTFCSKAADATDKTRVDSNALGIIQAMRETLTRKGEYASADEIERDQYATNKRGIPYYELALNSLAQKFADAFNQMNQLPLEQIYDMSTPAVPADPNIPGDLGTPAKAVDLDKVIRDANGNPVKDADGNELKWGDVVEKVPLLDINLEQVLAPEQVQATDEDGNLVYETDENGDLVLDDGNHPVPKMITVMQPQYQYQFKTAPTDENGDPITDPKKLEAETRKLADNVSLVRQNAVKVKGYEFYDGGVLFSNNGDNNDPSGITAANISISHAWSTHTVRMLSDTEKDQVDENGKVTEHSTNGLNIAHMISQFDRKRDYFAKDVREEAKTDLPIFHGSFREVLTSIGSTLGIDQDTTYSISENYTQSALSLDNDRLSVSGVDLNEEATSMMQFSKSYAAACRLLTTIDSMLDTLINGTR